MELRMIQLTWSLLRCERRDEAGKFLNFINKQKEACTSWIFRISFTTFSYCCLRLGLNSYPCHTSQTFLRDRWEMKMKMSIWRWVASSRACQFQLLFLLPLHRYTWNGKNSQYPVLKTMRYPRYNTPNPIVTCFVVNLNVLKSINVIPLTLPQHLNYGMEEYYVTNMFWISNSELTITFTARSQMMASTLLCSAPDFHCVEVSTLHANFDTNDILIFKFKIYLVLDHQKILCRMSKFHPICFSYG